MPQGKGTYGTQQGRPPKKKYHKGGIVAPPPVMSPLLGALPVSDARNRMTNTPGFGGRTRIGGLGGDVMGGLKAPGLSYNKGGKVKNKK